MLMKSLNQQEHLTEHLPVATCAIIKKQGKYLVAQRSSVMKYPLKWEFPGGRLEVHETLEECVIREIKEELGVDIEILEYWGSVESLDPVYPLHLHGYFCRIISGIPRCLEHQDIKWLGPEELKSMSWASSDLPFVEKLIRKADENQ